MLGYGRPFILEIYNPRNVLKNKEDIHFLPKVLKEIKDNKKVEILDLKFSDKSIYKDMHNS